MTRWNGRDWRFDDKLINPNYKIVYEYKKALFELQKQWKSELNKIREDEIKGDFCDT